MSLPYLAKQTGVALIEAMVALAVVAIALTALLHSLNISSDSHQHLRNKTHARWLASNQLNIAYINYRYFQETDKVRGTESLGTQDFQWLLSKQGSGLAGIQRWQLHINLVDKEASVDAKNKLLTVERLVPQ